MSERLSAHQGVRYSQTLVSVDEYKNSRVTSGARYRKRRGPLLFSPVSRSFLISLVAHPRPPAIVLTD